MTLDVVDRQQEDCEVRFTRGNKDIGVGTIIQ